MHRLCLAILLSVPFGACSSSSMGTPDDGGMPPPTDALLPKADAGAPPAEAGTADAGVPCAAQTAVVALTTDDGVALEADYRSTGVSGGPAIVLLHMIPPHHDRTNYSDSFISALVDAGFSVLNVDRRGAGGSQGVATDAYNGPNGWLDAKAAVDFLTAAPCAADASRIAIVGASNGTTTALDYAIAAQTRGRPAPKALVFLTGGTYTENQNRVAAHRPTLDQQRILFVYSTVEAAWSAALQPTAPAAWDFREYPSGDHGTRIFDAAPASLDDVVDFLTTNTR